MTDGTKTIVAFATDCFDLSWPTDGRDPNSPSLGKDAADYFRRKLTELGVHVIGSDAVLGEGGWHWNASIGRDEYSLFIHWAPLGNPPRDFWIIQVDKQLGFVARLLGKREPPNVVQIVAALRQIIETEPRFAEVRWLTAEEFREIY